MNGLEIVKLAEPLTDEECRKATDIACRLFTALDCWGKDQVVVISQSTKKTDDKDWINVKWYSGPSAKSILDFTEGSKARWFWPIIWIATGAVLSQLLRLLGSVLRNLG